MTMAEICQYNSHVQDPNVHKGHGYPQKTAIHHGPDSNKHDQKRRKTAEKRPENRGVGGNLGPRVSVTPLSPPYFPKNTPTTRSYLPFPHHNLAPSTQQNPKKAAICQPRQLPAVYVAFPTTPVVMQGRRDFCPQSQTGTGVPA